MKTKDLIALGFSSSVAPRAVPVIRALAGTGAGRPEIEATLKRLLEDPARYRDAPLVGELAALVERSLTTAYRPREKPAPWRQWGSGLEELAVGQMRDAAALPVAVCGALMPDAHPGYGLPIGGVLATEGAVIPYAVGVDIACRMKLSVLDRPVEHLARRAEELAGALEKETSFGYGAGFAVRREHAVLDEDWSFSDVTRRVKDRAAKQLGSSGSGNHFVEFGELTVRGEAAATELGLPAPGTYLALLSHSGSRGAGHAVATHFSKLAAARMPDLPKRLSRLAWLDLDSAEGEEYWSAMELMGRYASANHDRIHHHVTEALGAEVLAGVENHHNFAWRETLPDGREVIVHRKGATPAHAGTLGVIPGTMADPAYVVRGLGSASALNSASHGAGRRMSRAEAKRRFSWSEAQKLLDERRVQLLTAGLDEVPMAYKDIREVMAAQADLVETLATFLPRLVKMAPAGERPED